MISIETMLSRLPDAAILHRNGEVLSANDNARSLTSHAPFRAQLAGCMTDSDVFWVDPDIKLWRLRTSQFDDGRHLTIASKLSDSIFSEVFHGNPHPVVIHDWFKPLYANQAYADLFELDSVEEVLKLPSMRAVIDKRHWEQAKRNYREVIERGYLEVPFVEDSRSASGTRIRSTIFDFAVRWQGKLVLCTLTSQATIAEEQRDHFRRMAMTDPLTGLANRRCFDSESHRRLASLAEAFDNVCMMVIDIDHFKEINDSFGHPAGDRVLQSLSQQLREFPLVDALVCRVGGEEFAVICGYNNDQLHPAQQVKQGLDQWDWPLRTADKRKITVSIGVAHLQNNDDFYRLYQRADDALYDAKEGGRNQVRTDKKQPL